MSLKRTSWVAAAALVVGQPLWAGTVYVPLAADIQIDDIRYETQIWVSNKGIENRRFTGYFIEAGTNGATRPDGITYEGVTVNGLTTVLVDNLAPTDKAGLFEITGAPQLIVSARIFPGGQGDNALGASLPVISSENLLAANTTAYLQGLARDSARVTDLGIANIGKAEASCTVANVTAAGANLGNSAVVTVPALSLTRYADVLALLGQTTLSGARTTITCNQTFFPYAVTFQRNTGEVNVISPSEALTSTLTRPGDEPPPPPPGECPTGAVCFDQEGVFHTPTNSNRVRRIEFPVPAGRYSKLHLRMQFYNGGWLSPTSGLHNIFWLAKDRNYNLYGYANLRGPERYTMLFRHGVRLEAPAKPKIEVPFAAQPGQTYTVDYTYDPVHHSLVLLILDQAGTTELLRAVGAPNVNAVNVDPGEKFLMDFGFSGENPLEPPTVGWRYQNLHLEFIP